MKGQVMLIIEKIMKRYTNLAFLPQKSKGKKHFWYIFVDAEEDEIIAGAEEAVLCGEESKILAAFSWTIHN